MHTFLAFFAWPNGSAWSNVIAMPVCGVIAAAFAFLARDRIGKALRGWWHTHLGHRAELDALNARLDEHANLLDHETAGGLGAVWTELRDLKAAVEAQAAGVEALVSITKPAPRRGATQMRKTAGAKDGSDGKTGSA